MRATNVSPSNDSKLPFKATLTMRKTKVSSQLSARVGVPPLKQSLIKKRKIREETSRRNSILCKPPKFLLENHVVLSKSKVKNLILAKKSDDQKVRKNFRGSHDDDIDRIVQDIRKMFGYDPNKYGDDDYDDRNMVVGFHELQREEERIERMLRDKEKRKRLKKEAKKCKIGEMHKHGSRIR